MSDLFIIKEVDKIFAQPELAYPLNMAMATTWIMGNKKAINLKIIDVRGKSSLTDFFVLASCSNTVQARSIAEEIMANMKRHSHSIRSREGMEEADWILIDLGDVIVHLFEETARDFFDLDSLWKDSPLIDIPNDYYYSSDENSDSKNDLTKDSEEDYY